MIEPKDISKKHFYISIIKSILRIIGCGIILISIKWFAILFVAAEILGIIEEI